MITDSQFSAWMSSGSPKVVLVQADHSGGTKYISNTPITVGGNYYEPVLRNSFSISNTITMDFDSSISYSDIELINGNGELDSWLDLVWVNRGIRVYIGDASWTDLANDFRNIFTGIIGDLESKSRSSLNITVRSPLQLLNVAIGENLLGNYNPRALVGYENLNANQLKPLVFGEVHNITPLLTSPELLEYMVNDGTVEQIIEVRDNGVPVQFITTAVVGDPAIPAGSFRLVRPLAGTCTADVQGLKESRNLTTGAVQTTYTNSAANIIATIINKYGKAVSASNLNLPSFAAATNVPVGIYINSRANVFSICNEIAKSAAMVLTTTNAGKISIVEPRPATAASVEIKDSAAVMNSLTISGKSEVEAAYRLGYSKNWTIQTNLLTGIPEEHKVLLGQEYVELVVSNGTVASVFLIEKEVDVEGSLLIDTTTATNILMVKHNIKKIPRTSYRMTLVSDYINIEPGSTVLLNVGRFGLTSKYGLVLSSKPNWYAGKIDIEVLV